MIMTRLAKFHSQSRITGQIERDNIYHNRSWKMSMVDMGPQEVNDEDE